jgi:EAL domain-containing protein (putative c-di-GMP-specific phosphodiesterase class I)/PAS domain-containing protein
MGDLVIWAAETVSAVGTVASGSVDLGRGAILGAMLVGAAFLSGVAILRNSPAALWGVVMVGAAGALLAVWLGVAPLSGKSVDFFLQGVFAASALIFLSASVGLVSRSHLLGGLLFAGALSIAGVGLLNALQAGEAAALQRIGNLGVGAAALALSALGALRGDLGARLVLPGAVIAAASPFLFSVEATGAAMLAPYALFGVGVLLASLVAMVGVSNARVAPGPGLSHSFDAPPESSPAIHREKSLRVSENQLAQVLDYSGVSVWDWNRDGAHQTQSFGDMLGADSNGLFTPEVLRDFVHAEDIARFEERIFGATEGDGGFDELIKIHSGKTVRMRGARAVDRNGALERIVVFLEPANVRTASAPASGDALKLAAATLTSAAIPPKAALANKPATIPAAKKEPVAKDPIFAAIETGAVTAAFQPIVSFETRRVVGSEALVRWPGVESRVEDVPKRASEAGKLRELTALMIDKAAGHAAARIKEGDAAYFVAINVSASQLAQPTFVDEVKQAITNHKLPRKALVIEVTEAEKLAETPAMVETFKALRAAGAALAYDDFGAGYSSLSNLHRYEFDYLKIDKSFIDGLASNGGKKKIAAALARLGKEFDMTVIAEGIETREAAETAKSIGCKLGQGYFLGAPSVIAFAAAEAPKALVGASSSAEEASVEIVLDRSMAAPTPTQPTGGYRKRLFSR